MNVLRDPDTGAYQLVCIPGDGIGPEVTSAAKRVLDALPIKFAWVDVDAGEAALQQHGNPLPESTINAIAKFRCCLKGPTMTPTGTGYRSVNVALRERFETYACVRPFRRIPGIRSRFSDLPIDIVLFRENLEDLYTGIERSYTPKDDIFDIQHRLEQIFGQRLGERAWQLNPKDSGALALKVITPGRSADIAMAAFDYAIRYDRKRVTCIHKANILKKTDGMFLEAFQCVSKLKTQDPPFVNLVRDDLIIDNAAQQLVLHPERFDVLVCLNLYGDILSDLCAGLVGGLGICPEANIGKDYAIFEAVHGTAPDIARQHKANPTAMILSAMMMLEHLGEATAAGLLRNAVDAVIADGRQVTGDIFDRTRFPDGTPASTEAMTDAIIAELQDRYADHEITFGSPTM